MQTFVRTVNPVLLQTNITFNLPSGAAASQTAPQNVRNKTVFDDSSTNDSSSEEEEDQDTVDARNEQYTEDVHDDDAETEAPTTADTRRDARTDA